MGFFNEDIFMVEVCLVKLYSESSSCEGIVMAGASSRDCPNCDGSGIDRWTAMCSHCLGLGIVQPCAPDFVARLCYRCNGTGKVNVSCMQCHGSGQVGVVKPV